MSRPTILGDWGTSRLRLYLCEIDAGSATVRGAVEGPGAKFTEDFARAFREAAARLPDHPADCPVVLAGMVGSNIGWAETPYVRCPVSWDALGAGAAVVHLERHRVVILPGASCRSRYGYTDVMRGEETQLRGIFAMQPATSRSRLVCLPGTHTKWATIDAARLQGFTTTVQGELYELLRRYSILVPREEQPAFDPSSFAAAVELLRRNPRLGLLEALFSTRCRRLTGEPAAASWLSGLLVGSDIRDTGQRILAETDVELPVLLVGDPVLTGLYSTALRQVDIPAQRFAGEECLLRGLAASSALRGEEPVVEP